MVGQPSTSSLRSVPLRGASSADVPPPLASPLGSSSFLWERELSWHAASCAGAVWRAASCACQVSAPWFSASAFQC